MRRLLHLLTSLLATAGLASASDSESFSFWPGKGAEKAAGFEQMSEHPCGHVADARVSKLPAAGKGPLISELVVELGRGGKVIRRWPMPADYTPRGLKGEELLFGNGHKSFWVQSNGAFRRASPVPASDKMPFQCDLKSVFGKSNYVECRIFVDLASGKERTLGYQAVCS